MPLQAVTSQSLCQSLSVAARVYILPLLCAQHQCTKGLAQFSARSLNTRCILGRCLPVDLNRTKHLLVMEVLQSTSQPVCSRALGSWTTTRTWCSTGTRCSGAPPRCWPSSPTPAPITCWCGFVDCGITDPKPAPMPSCGKRLWATRPELRDRSLTRQLHKCTACYHGGRA